MRGFLLTLDALLGLALVSLALSFFAVSTFSPGPAASAMFLGGRDYLSAGPAAVDVERLLSEKGWRVSAAPQPSRFSVRVPHHFLNRVCFGAVPPDAPCLSQPDAAFGHQPSVVWVSVP
ncbi:MAG: hypothetical protein Q8P02_04710 [Candidatus Micrarchaeota archaeon]|nr:hypothetical protein [Candidatus Micrarchaeota archaeon]